MRLLIISMGLMFLFTTSCGGIEYTTQHFSFPPGSKPHENDWQYTAQVIVTSKKRPITIKSKKEVTIKVYDRNKTIYLNENFEFDSASINANVAWDEFEEIRVELVEIGNEYAKDDYNKQLVKSGPHQLVDVVYKYDKKLNQFSSFRERN